MPLPVNEVANEEVTLYDRYYMEENLLTFGVEPTCPKCHGGNAMLNNHFTSSELGENAPAVTCRDCGFTVPNHLIVRKKTLRDVGEINVRIIHAFRQFDGVEQCAIYITEDFNHAASDVLPCSKRGVWEIQSVNGFYIRGIEDAEIPLNLWLLEVPEVDIEVLQT